MRAENGQPQIRYPHNSNVRQNLLLTYAKWVGATILLKKNYTWKNLKNVNMDMFQKMIEALEIRKILEKTSEVKQ